MPDIEDIMASSGRSPRARRQLSVQSYWRRHGQETFDALCDIAEDHDLWIISDEVCEDFLYDGAVHHSFNERIERAVVLNSFSKSLAVPGWRLGYLTASAELVNEIAKMQYHLVAAPDPAAVRPGGLLPCPAALPRRGRSAVRPAEGAHG